MENRPENKIRGYDKVKTKVNGKCPVAKVRVPKSGLFWLSSLRDLSLCSCLCPDPKPVLSQPCNWHRKVSSQTQTEVSWESGARRHLEEQLEA